MGIPEEIHTLMASKVIQIEESCKIANEVAKMEEFLGSDLKLLTRHNQKVGNLVSNIDLDLEIVQNQLVSLNSINFTPIELTISQSKSSNLSKSSTNNKSINSSGYFSSKPSNYNLVSQTHSQEGIYTVSQVDSLLTCTTTNSNSDENNSENELYLSRSERQTSGESNKIIETSQSKASTQIELLERKISIESDQFSIENNNNNNFSQTPISPTDLKFGKKSPPFRKISDNSTGTTSKFSCVTVSSFQDSDDSATNAIQEILKAGKIVPNQAQTQSQTNHLIPLPNQIIQRNFSKNDLKNLKTNHFAYLIYCLNKAETSKLNHNLLQSKAYLYDIYELLKELDLAFDQLSVNRSVTIFNLLNQYINSTNILEFLSIYNIQSFENLAVASHSSQVPVVLKSSSSVSLHEKYDRILQNTVIDRSSRQNSGELSSSDNQSLAMLDTIEEDHQEILASFSDASRLDILGLSNKLVAWLSASRRDLLNKPEISNLWENHNWQLANHNLEAAEILLEQQEAVIQQIKLIQEEETNKISSSENSLNSLSIASSPEKVMQRSQSMQSLKSKNKNQKKLSESINKLWKEYNNDLQDRRKYIDKVRNLSVDYENYFVNISSNSPKNINKSSESSEKLAKKSIEKLKKHKLHKALNYSISLFNRQQQLINEYYQNLLDILVSFESNKNHVDISKYHSQILYAENLLERINDLDPKTNLDRLSIFSGKKLKKIGKIGKIRNCDENKEQISHKIEIESEHIESDKEPLSHESNCDNSIKISKKNLKIYQSLQ